MANNYRQFSSALEFTKGREAIEKKWCEDRLALLERTTSSPDGDVVGEDEEIERYESRADFTSVVGEYQVWFSAEESGNVEHIADFVQEFLAKFRPKGCWSMTWADTCSKARLDEFSGGGVFVTATGQKWVEAGNWCYQETEKFNKVKGK